jgi:hypothetical protein
VLLNWDDKSAEALINTSSRSTSKVNLIGWWKSLEVTGDGAGIVSHAGLALLRQLADKTGLSGGLSRALASPRLLIHDRGRVTADLACAIADGSEVISDFRVLTDQKELFGLVASVPTAWRTLDEIAAGGPRALARITRAVNSARRQAWAAIEDRHGALPGVRIADKVLQGVTCIRLAAGLDQPGGQSQAGQVGATAAAGLVPDPVQVRADSADADVQLGCDLRVGTAGSGWSSEQLAEAFAYLGLTVFTSYFLNYAETDLDIPASAPGSGPGDAGPPAHASGAES